MGKLSSTKLYIQRPSIPRSEATDQSIHILVVLYVGKHEYL